MAGGPQPAVSLPTRWWLLPSVAGTSEMSPLYTLASPSPAATRELCDFLRRQKGEVEAETRMRKGRKVHSGSKPTSRENVSLRPPAPKPSGPVHVWTYGIHVATGTFKTLQ